MFLFGRISVLAVAVLAAAYSAYAFTQYRALWYLSRARLVVPRAVQLFHASLERSDQAKRVRHQSPQVEKGACVSPVVQEGEVAVEAGACSFSFANRSNMTDAPPSPISGPLVFVDTTMFEENVRAVTTLLLKNGKQVRLTTKGVRCPELLEHAAALMEKFAVSCPGYETIAPKKPFVAGLLTSTAAETLLWAQRGTFPSLLLGERVVDAANATLYVEAMTLNTSSKVHCLVVVDAVEQLELLWNAAKAWIADGGCIRMGFDNAVESLRFDLMILLDVTGNFPCNPLLHSDGTHTLRSPRHVAQFCNDVELFNSKIAKEASPVGVHFEIRGLWTNEHRQLSPMDIAPTFSSDAAFFVPVRWFLRYPLLQWYKHFVSKNLCRRRRLILQHLIYEKHLPRDWILTSGGSSASLVFSAEDDTLAEVCLGAGLLCGHQLDRYANSLFKPALYLALVVTQLAPRRTVICSGFGQSLPGVVAVYPPQLRCTRIHTTHIDEDLETGVMLLNTAPEERPIRIGDSVIFRPESSGVLAELVDCFLLITDKGEMSAAMRTYRGEGWNIWALNYTEYVLHMDTA